MAPTTNFINAFLLLTSMYREIDEHPETPGIREKIDEAIETLGPSEVIKGLPEEIALVEPAHSGCSCERYALGTNGLLDFLSGIFPNIDDPKAGDMILYYREGRGCVHIGILQEDGTVTSKWGKSGPVLNHPWDHVPNRYGDAVIYRRISQETVKELKK